MAFLAAPFSRTLVVSHAFGIIPALEPKDPDDVLNYVFDFGEWLDDEAVTLASYTVAIDAPTTPALAIDSHASDADPLASPAPIPGRNVCVWLSAGALDIDYLVRLRGVTSAGQTFDRSFWLPVRRR